MPETHPAKRHAFGVSDRTYKNTRLVSQPEADAQAIETYNAGCPRPNHLEPGTANETHVRKTLRCTVGRSDPIDHGNITRFQVF